MILVRKELVVNLSFNTFQVARGVYVYFLAKISELLDTVFFVIRKKNNQITFLHLYHHTVMPMISWGAAKYYPGGHGTLIGVINSFVHIIMYTYYMFAACGPQFQKYLFWKRHITTLQMVNIYHLTYSSQVLSIYKKIVTSNSIFEQANNAVMNHAIIVICTLNKIFIKINGIYIVCNWWTFQLNMVVFIFQLQFCITFLHSFQLIFYDCGYPRWSVVFTLPNSIFFYYLFYDFYYKAYGKPGGKGKAKLNAGVIKNHSENGHSNGIQNGHNKHNSIKEAKKEQ